MRCLVARFAVLCAFMLATLVSAQQPANVMPQPRISIVFPMGAKAGTTVEVTVTGTDIDDPTGLLFSNPEIRSELVETPEPKPDPKTKNPPKKQNRTGPQTTAKFKITVPASLTPGNYDVRLVGKFGASNPRAFVIGTLPEVEENAKPHNDVPEAQKIELNSTVNGTIQSTSDVDYYVFSAKSNQRILMSCVTSSIDSKARPLVELFDKAGQRLGGNRNYRENDALVDVTIPTDGDYYLRVCEFAYQSGSPEHFYRLTVTNGPWIDAVYPPAVQPGKATPVTLYGRNLPGGKAIPGMKIDGRSVESLSVTVTPPAERGKLEIRGSVAPPQALNDGFEYRVTGPTGVSNPVPIYLTDVPVALEKDAENDRPEQAEAITVPGEISGRIEKRGDKDWYSFTAKKGDVFYIELFADRIGSAMDMYLQIKNSTEKYPDISGELDDDPDVLHPQEFFNRNGDPAAYKFTAPADGKFLILVASRESNTNYGPRAIYRLRVARPNPDFRAVVMPNSRDLPMAPLAGQGANIALDVFVQRMDGFSEAIIATAEGLPAGVTATPALIGHGQKWGTLILNTADSAAPFTGPIKVTCTATTDNNKPLKQSARPATITWGVQQNQNIPTVARLDEQLILAIRPEKAHFKFALDLPGAKVKTKDKDNKEVEVKLESPIYVKPGDKLNLPFKATWTSSEPRANPLTVFLEASQPNMQNAPLGTPNNNPTQPILTIPKEKADGLITIDVRPKAEPGKYSLVFRSDTQVQYVRDSAKKDQKTNAVVSAYATPLEVTVLPTVLGKFTATPPANNQLKAGTTAEVLLKVDRTDYAGEFKVQLVLPKDTKSVTTKDVVIPANASEVKIPLEIAKDAKAGGLNGIVINVTGTVHGKFVIAHEVKVNNLQVQALPAEPKKK